MVKHVIFTIFIIWVRIELISNDHLLKVNVAVFNRNSMSFSFFFLTSFFRVSCPNFACYFLHNTICIIKGMLAKAVSFDICFQGQIKWYIKKALKITLLVLYYFILVIFFSRSIQKWQDYLNRFLLQDFG
jgi:hypothetical protein